MSHMPHIFVNCWSCKKDFDITEAERCYDHLNGNQYEIAITRSVEPETLRWTLKCSHCGSCICHKVSKMVPTDCAVLNSKGIKFVMPSLARQLKTKNKPMNSRNGVSSE